MLRYFSQEGLTRVQLKKVMNATKDIGLQSLYGRLYDLVSIAESAPGHSELAIRHNVMDEEISENHPAVRQWVLDHLAEQHGGWQKFRENEKDLAFLLDRELIHAHVTPYEIPVELTDTNQTSSK